MDFVRIDGETIQNIARKILTRAHAAREEASQQEIRRNMTDARFVRRPYDVWYTKYRSESIKQMVRTHNYPKP